MSNKRLDFVKISKYMGIYYLCKLVLNLSFYEMPFTGLFEKIYSLCLIWGITLEPVLLFAVLCHCQYEKPSEPST